MVMVDVMRLTRSLRLLRALLNGGEIWRRIPRQYRHARIQPCVQLIVGAVGPAFDAGG